MQPYCVMKGTAKTQVTDLQRQRRCISLVDSATGNSEGFHYFERNFTFEQIKAQSTERLTKLLYFVLLFPPYWSVAFSDWFCWWLRFTFLSLFGQCPLHLFLLQMKEQDTVVPRSSSKASTSHSGYGAYEKNVRPTLICVILNPRQAE